MPTIEQASGWYPHDDPVHGFDHVLRVLAMAEAIGAQMGADAEILKAAALLHDAAGAHPGPEGARGQHQLSSAEFAREILADEGWPNVRIEQVLHCIHAHRFRGDESPQTLEAQILFDSDKLDVVGAFGIARTIGYAIQARQPIYAMPSDQFLESGDKQPGEAHSAYHECLFKLSRVTDRLHTDLAKQMADERQQLLVSFFNQLDAEARVTVRDD
jgi:uncharacterized protein